MRTCRSQTFWGPPPPLLGTTAWLPLETRYSPHVTIPNFVAVDQSVWAYVGRKNLGDVGAPTPRPLGMGTWLTPRNMLLRTCITMPNLVILGQTTGK